MNITPKTVKRTLKRIIKEVSSNPHIFAKNPEKDFSRKRKHTAEKMMYSILSMSNKDLKCEMSVIILLNFKFYSNQLGGQKLLTCIKPEQIKTAAQFPQFCLLHYRRFALCA